MKSNQLLRIALLAIVFSNISNGKGILTQDGNTILEALSSVNPIYLPVKDEVNDVFGKGTSLAEAIEEY